MNEDPCSYDTDHYYNYLSKQVESMNYKLELNELQRELHKKDMRIAELESENILLREYYNNGIEVFASPCENHSGDGTAELSHPHQGHHPNSL